MATREAQQPKCPPDDDDAVAAALAADAAALELIGTILVLEPTRRATAAQALGARFFEGPDAPRVDLATLALSTAAACDAKRSAQVDSDEEDWNRGGWEGLG